MTRRGLWIGAVVLFLGGIALAGGLVSRSAARSDCPGKVVCPLTGEEVCRDRCPLIDPQRPDCPGKIACPLTGEPVCRDRCPLGPDSANSETSPRCCQGVR